MDVTAEDVRAALERVLRSPVFANAGRLSRMLRFLVDRTLAGEAGQLKEYVVGVEVFDRPADYDPRLDSIVRVEARRLRAKLAEYYDGDGRADPVRFRLPKGGYVPTIEAASATAPAPAGETVHVEPPAGISARSGRRVGPIAAAVLVLVLGAIGARAWFSRLPAAVDPATSIAVLPFHVFSGREDDRRLADRLADGVTTELGRQRTLAVAAYTLASQFRDPQRTSREIADALGVRVLMETTAHVEGDSVRLEARLVDATLGRKLWVEDFEGRRDDLDALERRVADGVSRFLLDPQRGPRRD